MKETDTVSADLTPHELERVDAIILKYRTRPGSLIPVLEEVQEAVGYLPVSIQERIARGLNLAYSEVFGVVTFYSFFSMVPRGRHTIRCCLGTACYVKGGKKLLDAVSRELKLAPGGTTEDRRFSLETVRCLGACGLAPVMTVGPDTFRQVKPAGISRLIEDYG